MKIRVALLFFVIALLVSSSASASFFDWMTGRSVEEPIKEEVKCVFLNSNSEQKCYASEGGFACSGVASCTVAVSGDAGKTLMWKSSCGGEMYTTIDGIYEYAEFKCEQSQPVAAVPAPVSEELVKEQVSCSFTSSNSEQKCYTGDGRFSCSGVGSCTAEVSGARGTKLIWKTSCASAPAIATLIDGVNENMGFACHESATATTSPAAAEIKEQVNCNFLKSTSYQKCYSDDGKFSCSGIEACLVDVSGVQGKQLAWKSSCGGYAYTTIDGNNEAAQFKCMPSSEVKEEQITGKGFKSSYWQCYDGVEQKPATGASVSCKPSDVWQKEAKEFCKDHCYADGSKCGVNSFSVSEECYPELTQKETMLPLPVTEKGVKEKPAQKEEKILICKDSCPLDGKCYPFGYRKEAKYCSDQGSFVLQLEEDKSCDNNFECSSNVCVDGKCMSSGTIQKILSWFKSLFG